MLTAATRTYQQSNLPLNPFERLPEELFEMIFQHLTGKDVLEIAKVSHQFDELISDSRKTRDKITLKLDEMTAGSDFRKFRRGYHHIRVKQQTLGRSMSLHEKLVQLLRQFARTLISVQVKTVMMGNTAVFKGDLLELKHLEISMLNKFLALSFWSAPNLKSLTLKVTMLNHAELLNFINRFKKLETLNVKLNVFAESTAGKLELELKKLEIQRQSNERTNVDDYLEEFLRSQSKTLKEITIKGIAHVASINLIFDELSIEKLTLNSIDNSHHLSSKANKTIQTLVLKTDQNCSSIIKAAVNLKTLHVHRISKSLIEFLRVEKKSLKTVTYVETENDSNDPDKFYEQEYFPKKMLNENTTIKFLKVR